MTRFETYVLPACSILFIFSAFYKTIIPSPFDLSIAAATLVCLCLLWRFRDLKDLIQPITILIVSVNVYLALRLFPAMTPWGIRKLASIWLFGLPALAAGFVISTNPRMRLATIQLFAYGSIPLALMVVRDGIISPIDFAAIGGAGYQLTGIFFAIAMIASAALGNSLTMTAAVMGALICGNITGFLFGIVSVMTVWALTFDWKSIATQIALPAAATALFSISVSLPLAVERTLILAFNITPHHATVVDAPRETPLILQTFAENTKKSMEEMSQGSTARLDIWKSGLEGVKQKPLLGWDFGNYNYAGTALAHNVLLEAQTEAGILASILILLVFSSAFVCAWKSLDPFAIGCLLLFFLDMMISGLWGARTSMFALGLIAGAAVVRQPRKSMAHGGPLLGSELNCTNNRLSRR